MKSSGTPSLDFLKRYARVVAVFGAMFLLAYILVIAESMKSVPEHRFADERSEKLKVMISDEEAKPLESPEKVAEVYKREGLDGLRRYNTNELESFLNPAYSPLLWNAAIVALESHQLEERAIDTIIAFIKQDVDWTRLTNEEMTVLPPGKAKAIRLLGLTKSSRAIEILERALVDDSYGIDLLGEWINDGDKCNPPFANEYVLMQLKAGAGLGLVYAENDSALLAYMSQLKPFILTMEYDKSPEFRNLHGHEFQTYSHLITALAHRSMIQKFGFDEYVAIKMDRLRYAEIFPEFYVNLRALYIE